MKTWEVVFRIVIISSIISDDQLWFLSRWIFARIGTGVFPFPLICFYVFLTGKRCESTLRINFHRHFVGLREFPLGNREGRFLIPNYHDVRVITTC